LIDVEAVDAKGNRVPTFQQRVDFQTDGPGVWRGGYNSGKVDSINHAFLDLEAGINRVAIRATRTAGTITLRARSAALEPGTVTVVTHAFAATDGVSAILPAETSVSLPPQSCTSRPTRAKGGTCTSIAITRFRICQAT